MPIKVPDQVASNEIKNKTKKKSNLLKMEVFSFFRQMKTEPEIISKNKKKTTEKVSIERKGFGSLFLPSFWLLYP